MFQHVPGWNLLRESITLVTPVVPYASVGTPPVPDVWKRASQWPVTPIAPILPDTPVTPLKPMVVKPNKPRPSSAHKLQRPPLPLTMAPKTNIAIPCKMLKGKLAVAKKRLAEAQARDLARLNLHRSLTLSF